MAAEITIRHAHDDDRRELAVIAADLQCRPDRHIAYVGQQAAAIAEEMIAEDDDWTAASVVAEVERSSGTEIVGWLMGSVDPEMGRVWWFGPFVEADDDGWAPIADALYAAATLRLDATVTEQEFAPDSRFTTLIEWATGLGFEIDPGSAVLTLAGAVAGSGGHDPAISIRPIAEHDTVALAELHDELFTGTHTTGAALAADAGEAHVRLVAEHGGVFAGYIAAELQPDGDGYIDYLGTDSTFRRRGIGAALVAAAVTAMRDLGAGDLDLTVREDNHGARALYARLGFREERVIVPLRRGFRLT